MNKKRIALFLVCSLLFHIFVLGGLLYLDFLPVILGNNPTEFDTVVLVDSRSSARPKRVISTSKKMILNASLSEDAASQSEVSTEASRAHSFDSTSTTNDLTAAVSNGVLPAEANQVTEGLRPLNLDEIKRLVKRTPQALEKNIVGQIKLRLLVDDKGIVRRVTPINSLGYGLDEVASTAAWKLLFLPARIGSKRVALETYYTVRFQLEYN